MLVLTALLGCSGASLQGTVTHGINGQPVADVKVIAKATDPGASISCQALEGTTDAAGAFTIPGLCAGTYTISLTDESLWLPDAGDVDPTSAGSLALEAWPAAGPSAYLFSDGELKSLKTSTDIKEVSLTGKKKKLRYAREVPEEGKAIPVKPGDTLVLGGRGWTIEPMTGSETWVETGEKKGDYQMRSWGWIGIEITEPMAWKDLDAAAPTGVVDKARGDRSAQYIPAKGLPPGRYAVLKKGSRRVIILDVGPAGKAKAKAKGKGDKAKGKGDKAKGKGDKGKGKGKGGKGKGKN